MGYGITAQLALLIFEGDFIPAILEAYGIASPSRMLVILAVAATAWPFVLPSQISALRYVAALSPFAILFVACNVVAEAPGLYAQRPTGSELQMWIWNPAQLLQTMSIFVFSVMCHANSVPVAHMLERPSVDRIVKVAAYPMLCCWALYMLIGVGGYLSFQAACQGDFLLNYPVGRPAILLCRKLMTVVCFVGIPLNSSNAVQALQNRLVAAVSADSEPQGDHPLLFAFLATLVLAAATASATVLTNVAQIISVVGGSLTTLQMFWIPAYIYWKVLYPTQPPVFRKCVIGAMVMGGVAGFASVLATILPKVL